MAALWSDCAARVRGYCWLCEGRCAFKSRPPLDPLIDIVLSQCMHCPAMTDIVPVENLCIGALHRTTQNHTEPHRAVHRTPHGPTQNHTEPHTDRLMDSWWMKGGQHQLSREQQKKQQQLTRMDWCKYYVVKWQAQQNYDLFLYCLREYLQQSTKHSDSWSVGLLKYSEDLEIR